LEGHPQVKFIVITAEKQTFLSVTLPADRHFYAFRDRN
jgi:hypothetical protein